MKSILDANVILRFLVEDDKEKAERFKRRLQRSGDTFLLTDVTVAEMVWVLSSYYEVEKAEIVAKLQALLEVKTISANTAVLSKALQIFLTYPVDYIDAYFAAYAQVSGIETIVSYDKDFDRLSEITRTEP